MQEIRAVMGGCCCCCPLFVLKLEEFLPALRLGFALILLLHHPPGGCYSEKDAGFITMVVWWQMETELWGRRGRLFIPFSLQIAPSHLELERLRVGAWETRASQYNLMRRDRKSCASSWNFPEIESSTFHRAEHLTSLFSIEMYLTYNVA